MKKALIVLLTPIVIVLALGTQAAGLTFSQGPVPPVSMAPPLLPDIFPPPPLPEILCSGPPVISDVAIKPDNIWAPSNTDIEIEISGLISTTGGCEVSADYTLENNNGIAIGNITIDPEGYFTETVPVNVTKDGKEKEGKYYMGTISAVDSEGNKAGVEFFVTVLHDKGKKLRKNK